VSDDPDNGLRAFEALGQFLETDDWYPQQVEDMLLYRAAFEGENGEGICFAQIEPELELFIFYAYAPLKVPAAQRAAVAEFVNRANYGMWIGNFELDYTDGEVRFKGSVAFKDTTLTEALIRNTIYASVGALHQYLPGLRDVVDGQTSPAAAIASIETNEG
jgi:hypothetical protein